MTDPPTRWRRNKTRFERKNARWYPFTRTLILPNGFATKNQTKCKELGWVGGVAKLSAEACYPLKCDRFDLAQSSLKTKNICKQKHSRKSFGQFVRITSSSVIHLSERGACVIHLPRLLSQYFAYLSSRQWNTYLQTQNEHKPLQYRYVFGHEQEGDEHFGYYDDDDDYDYLLL